MGIHRQRRHGPCRAHLREPSRLGMVDSGDGRPGLCEQNLAGARKREHVVGHEGSASSRELERRRGLARARSAEERDRPAFDRDGAGVQDLEPAQQRREGQHLADQQPLPVTRAATLGGASQPSPVGGEQMAAVGWAPDQKTALGVSLDAKAHAAVGLALVADEPR